MKSSMRCPTLCCWSTAPGGGIEYLNQRWLKYTGLSPEETEGWEWQRIVHPDDLPGALANSPLRISIARKCADSHERGRWVKTGWSHLTHRRSSVLGRYLRPHRRFHKNETFPYYSLIFPVGFSDCS
ncbi:MAG: PAS domain-containing protein [Gammaproteobacteria bacterium]